MVRADAFASFFDPLPEAMLLVDGSTTIIGANRAARTFFGRPGDLVGIRLEVLSDGDEEATREFVRVSARSRSLVPGGVRFRMSGGGITNCRCEGALLSPRSDSAPAIVLLRIESREAAATQFIGLNLRIEELTREVARRRAAEFALQEHSNRLRVTLGSIGDAVIATDAAGNVTLMNAVAQTLTGWPFEEARGRPLAEVFVIINEFSRAEVESPVARVLREGGVVGLANHTLLVGRDGTERPIDDSGAAIEDDSGHLIGVVLVFHDITLRHQMERELRSQTVQLEENDRRKNEFLAMLAHELRNPLAPMATGVYRLKNFAHSAEEIGKTAAMLGRQLGHITRLIDDLLDIARLTSGGIELRRSPAKLQAVLEQAVEVSRPLIDSRKHQLVTRHAADASIDADADRLVQVFGNLLNNAAKFTPLGGGIWLESHLEENVAFITVRDSGDGIDSTLLPHVFDLFTQGARALDRSQGGLGIGLTVVRSIVSMHGGTVEARSAGVGRGSTFVVRLPLANATDLHFPGDGARTSTTTRPNDRRLLVVDDNEDAAEAIASVALSWGYQVQTAFSAAEALACVEAWTPSIFLLDIGLPDMDGYGLARLIRQRTHGGSVLLVAISGYGHNADPDATASGFDHYLTKPADLARLETILNAFEPAGRRDFD